MKYQPSIRLVAAAATATAVLALSACGSDGDDTAGDAPPVTDTSSSEAPAVDTADLRNGTVPTEDPQDAWESSDDLPSEPGDDASLSEQVGYELLSETIEFAHDIDPDATVDCPDLKFDEDAEVTCDMTFFGQNLSWDVSVTGGSMIANYEYSSTDRVLSRQYVEDALRFKTQAEDVACELEEYQLVNPESGPGDVICTSGGDEPATWELSLSGYGSASFYEQF